MRLCLIRSEICVPVQLQTSGILVLSLQPVYIGFLCFFERTHLFLRRCRSFLCSFILSTEYITEQKSIQEELPEAQARLTELKDSEGNALRFIENARKYTEITELTLEILHTFIQRVEVGERAERYSRTAPQEIRIYYRDIGIVDDIPETMDISEFYEDWPDDVA